MASDVMGSRYGESYIECALSLPAQGAFQDFGPFSLVVEALDREQQLPFVCQVKIRLKHRDEGDSRLLAFSHKHQQACRGHRAKGGQYHG